MAKFRKKPVVIEAVLWTGENADEFRALSPVDRTVYIEGPALYVKTLEGLMRADVGDWIIRGVQGEVYPCKPDIFAMTYEPVE